MSVYKYSDFEDQLKASGLSGQFSTADMELARKDPDAGIAILTAKKNYASAANPTARALANAEAESVRRKYGYMGGNTGIGNTPLTPMGYTYSEAPTYADEYKDRINTALSKVENRPEFTYDAASDPVYQAYDKKYTREGQLATEDVLGKASAMTGGAPSTAAITAAGQTANQYAAAKADIIPTLYQQAFDRAMAEFNADRAVLGDTLAVDSQEFGKYQTELGQHNTENAFKYGQLLDEIGAQGSVRDEEFTKQQYADALKQQEIENQRYDTQYADTLKQQQFDNWLVSEELKDSREQQKKQNEYTERELSRLEANAAIDNAYTTEQLNQLKEGKTGDTDTYKEMKATYDAVYDSKTRDLKSHLKEILNSDTSIDINETPEDLIENILPFETWYRLKELGYGDYSGYKSYDEYIESEYNSIIDYVTSKGGK